MKEEHSEGVLKLDRGLDWVSAWSPGDVAGSNGCPGLLTPHQVDFQVCHSAGKF